ncbi:MAG: MFS transporter [Bacteroidetes bacterium]|nr:MFS transporter [Bacteroidota bacterium]
MPKGIWVLGLGSLFMDLSSELVHSLLPVFLVTTLGVSVLTVGLIEGMAEATAAITKVFSGALSDYLRKRKLLLILGYGLAALTKPIFPLASSAGWVFTARFVDRIGKGIRGAPRDALVSEITPKAHLGAAFGLRQALDSVGALLGPLVAVILMVVFVNDIRSVLWFAVIPAFIAVAILVFFLKEPATIAGSASEPKRLPITIRDLKLLPKDFWWIVGLGAVFSLARFSEAFLVIRAQGIGLELAYVPVVMIVMNVLYAAASFPAGAAADRFDKRKLLLLGLLLLIAADVVLALASTTNMVLIGAAIWGLHMAFTQGLLSKLVADAAPQNLLGTAFGIFNLVSGISLLFASLIAGAMWTSIGASATFFTGAALATLVVIGLGYESLRNKTVSA